MESTPGSLFQTLKTHQNVIVKILGLSSSGMRNVLWHGKVYTIKDHPSFQENAVLRLSWNKKYQTFEPVEIPSTVEKEESKIKPKDEIHQQALVEHPQFEEIPEELPEGFSNYLTRDHNFDQESEQNSSEEGESDEVKLVSEILRWAISNFQKVEKDSQWIQLPILLPTQPNWNIRAGFLWTQQKHKIKKAFIEIRYENTVKIWWFLSDYLGKWYIYKGKDKDGKSRVDFYL
jgi:hypothetical protein